MHQQLDFPVLKILHPLEKSCNFMSDQPTEGQLNAVERRLLAEAIIGAEEKPKVLIGVGTWYGGGSTSHILRALEQNGVGHLWGIEADRSVYERSRSQIVGFTLQSGGNRRRHSSCERLRFLFAASARPSGVAAV